MSSDKFALWTEVNVCPWIKIPFDYQFQLKMYILYFKFNKQTNKNWKLYSQQQHGTVQAELSGLNLIAWVRRMAETSRFQTETMSSYDEV